MAKPIKANASFVDNKKVSDHHAIIPTEQFVQLDHMTIDERRVYDLVDVYKRQGTGFVPARTKKRAAYAARWRRLFFSFRPSAADGAAVRDVYKRQGADRPVSSGI